MNNSDKAIEMINDLCQLGYTISKIERECGLSNASLQKVHKNNREISLNNFNKLSALHASKCVGVSGASENRTIGMASLYQKLTQFGDGLTIRDIYDMKESTLFGEIINIKDIEASPPYITEFKYSVERKIKMILFVACSYSKDSPYMKTSDTIYNIKKNVIDNLDIDEDLSQRILEFKIPELESVIKYYIQREDNHFIREYLTCMSIYDRNLYAAASAIGPDGSVDLKKQTDFFNAAEEFKEKAFRLRQQVESNDSVFYEMKKDFIESVRSVRCEDLIP